MKRLVERSFFIVAIVVLVTALALSLTAQARSKKQEFGHPLLSRRLFVENPNDIIVNLTPLRSQIREYLSKTGYEYSFYLEYLPSGSSIRAGDTDTFVGASLMKLPVIMDLYKAYELNRLRPDQEIKISDQAVSQKFGKLWQAGVGSSIKLNEAAKLAIEESDNTAARLILEQTQKVLSARERSLGFLDAEIKEDEADQQPVILISARSYSSFLRCLYLSCYLSYDNSEAILQLLTQPGFRDKLVAGINDPTVKVAHKIGTFSEKVSSDCGIVYVPKRPYSICLMFNSTNQDTNQHFANVSKMAYDYIQSVEN